MQHLTGFAPLAERYDGFVLDLWGVIHDGVNAFPHAIDCLRHLRAAGKRTLLLSNVPRPNAAVQTMMRRMGIADDALHRHPDQRRGGAARVAVAAGPVVGGAGAARVPPGARARPAVLEGLPLTRVANPAEADFVLNTGAGRPPQPSTEVRVRERCCRPARGMRLPMICANPDLVVIRGGVRVLCAGALARRYEELGGIARSIGKPDPSDLPAGAGDAGHAEAAGAGGRRRAAHRHRRGGGRRRRCVLGARRHPCGGTGERYRAYRGRGCGRKSASDCHGACLRLVRLELSPPRG